MKPNKLVLGLIAGVAVGAAIGVMFAPDKGAQTRKKVLRKGSHQAEDIKNQIHDIRESAEKKYAESINTAEQKIRKLIDCIPNITK